MPPIELMKASSFVVSERSLQQLDNTPTLSLTKKFESDHLMLWSEHQRAKGSSTNCLSL